MTTIVIPITDILGHKNKVDLDNLLDNISIVYGQPTVVCCFDSCNWDFVEYFKEKYSWIISIENRGKAHQFTKNSNQGLKLAYKAFPDYGVLLVNQDCRLPKNILDMENAGICTAVAAKELTAVDNPTYEDVERFAFFCTYFSPQALSKVGLLDEAFIKVFSDDDYCLRTHLAGLPVQKCNINVYHEGSFIDTSEKGWTSASGCYNEQDLGLGFLQYTNKWSCQNTNHDDMIKTVISKFKWDDKFKC